MKTLKLNETRKARADRSVGRQTAALSRWMIRMALGVGVCAGLMAPLGASEFTEPDVVVFGKVVNLAGGLARPLSSGTLKLVLVNPADPQHPITRTVNLQPVGPSGAYSFRESIPMRVAPSSADAASASGFTVSAQSLAYTVASATVDGIAARLLDPAQVRRLLIGGAARGREFQVDLAVSRPELDSDQDQAPDWWEDQHGLKKFVAGDAVLDPDGDGLNNLQEFQRGTDPQVANRVPLVMETRFLVSAGSTAGVVVDLVAQGSEPSGLQLSFTNEAPGLSWFLDGKSLGTGTEFSYQAMRDGRVAVKASMEFQSGTVPLQIRYTTSGGTNDAVAFPLRFEAFSPGIGLAEVPVLWWDPRKAGPEGFEISEWADGSGLHRDGYQGTASQRPIVRAQGVRFEAGRFLYVDDRGWNSPEFTALAAFDADPGSQGTQTVLRTPDLQLDIRTRGGTRYLQARQSGRTTLSPMAGADGAGVYTVTAGALATQVEFPEAGASLSATEAGPFAGALSTVGAAFPLGARSATNGFQGDLRELIVFGTALPPISRAHLQNYQLSRWEGFVAWNYHNHTLPVRLTGQKDARNTFHGGYGDDVITGGSLGDILRAGPGRNVLTGSQGPDRFVFAKSGSHDVITDFDAADGDVVDLADLFDAPSRATRPEVQIRSQVVRGTNNLPQVDTVIDIRSGGAGTPIDQTITLLGVGELPSGSLRLPSVGTVPTPPSFVTVEPGGTVQGDAQWKAPVPNVVDGSVAVDKDGVSVPITQSPAAGTLVGPGSIPITLTATDAAGNTATATTRVQVTGTVSWVPAAAGGFGITVPPGTVLEAAMELTGPWQPHPGSGRVDIVPNPALKARFFRLRAQ